MKINGTNPPLPLDSASGKARAAKDTSQSGSVTGVANQFSALETQLGDNGLDTAKIESLKAAIREGKFHVNAEAVADKLIESARELAGRK